MNLELVIGYGLLLLGALLFVVINLVFNLKLNRAANGRTITLVLMWTGMFLAFVALVSMASEVLR